MLGYFAVPALQLKHRLLWTLGLTLTFSAAAYQAQAAASDAAAHAVVSGDNAGAGSTASATSAKHQPASAVAKASASKQAGQTATAKTEADSDEPIVFAEHIDPLPALGEGKDDFSDIDERAARYRKEATEESEDARIERELRDIKTADAKAEVERAKRDAAQRAVSNSKAREQAKLDAQHDHKRMQEAEAKAKAIQGIPNDELNWRGLED